MRIAALRIFRAGTLSMLLLLLLLLLAALSLSSAEARTCARFASPRGSDRASGTARHPYATARRLANALRPGQTGCLRAGVYRQDLTVRHGGTQGAPIALRSYPGERATIMGRVYLARGAAYTTISDLKLIGREHGHACASMCPSPTVNADHTTFIHDDVTNDHADASCFLLGDSHGVYGSANYTTIEDDRIHDCGMLPPTNYDHGIYVEESRGSRIIGNVTDHNADRGIQLYPQAIGTQIIGNIIDHNGEGVLFGAIGWQSSIDNLVEDNIITNSLVHYNVAANYGPGDRVGSGNIVRSNCIGGGATDGAGNPGGIRFDHAGFQLSHNVLAVPALSTKVPGVLSLPSLVPGTVSPASANPCRGRRLRPFHSR